MVSSIVSYLYEWAATATFALGDALGRNDFTRFGQGAAGNEISKGRLPF